MHCSVGLDKGKRADPWHQQLIFGEYLKSCKLFWYFLLKIFATRNRKNGELCLCKNCWKAKIYVQLHWLQMRGEATLTWEVSEKWLPLSMNDLIMFFLDLEGDVTTPNYWLCIDIVTLSDRETRSSILFWWLASWAACFVEITSTMLGNTVHKNDPCGIHRDYRLETCYYYLSLSWLTKLDRGDCCWSLNWAGRGC